ncbi:hypothetical protein BMAA1959 [Burkholderia mallei ATCC 23344]|uniref:Uncharacterized protein n=1 Tax=Burkholderia mallei (strain ATCC 23344) TaxID=243160 RepID=A0A0H2W9X8_BURMA|nr:hypothetical protein BMAA1959 [Burkholderia mallei ATCC 23344]
MADRRAPAFAGERGGPAARFGRCPCPCPRSCSRRAPFRVRPFRIDGAAPPRVTRPASDAARRFITPSLLREQHVQLNHDIRRERERYPAIAAVPRDQQTIAVRLLLDRHQRVACRHEAPAVRQSARLLDRHRCPRVRQFLDQLAELVRRQRHRMLAERERDLVLRRPCDVQRKRAVRGLRRRHGRGGLGLDHRPVALGLRGERLRCCLVARRARGGGLGGRALGRGLLEQRLGRILVGRRLSGGLLRGGAIGGGLRGERFGRGLGVGGLLGRARLGSRAVRRRLGGGVLRGGAIGLGLRGGLLRRRPIGGGLLRERLRLRLVGGGLLGRVFGRGALGGRLRGERLGRGLLGRRSSRRLLGCGALRRRLGHRVLGGRALRRCLGDERFGRGFVRRRLRCRVFGGSAIRRRLRGERLGGGFVFGRLRRRSLGGGALRRRLHRERFGRGLVGDRLRGGRFGRGLDGCGLPGERVGGFLVGGRLGGEGFERRLLDGHAGGLRVFLGGCFEGGLRGGLVRGGGYGGVPSSARDFAHRADELIEAAVERIDLIVQVHACILYVRPAILPAGLMRIRTSHVTKCWRCGARRSARRRRERRWRFGHASAMFRRRRCARAGRIERTGPPARSAPARVRTPRAVGAQRR